MNVSDDLIKILEMSHTQTMSGQTLTMDEVEHFMYDKAYELTHSVDTYCVAESL